MDLVREYCARQSEPAFETLVHRHVNLVYSTALRQVGNLAQAEEITQAVFVILARKAARLRPQTVLAAWLHETARYVAASFLRGEIRRRRREQEAYMQSTLQPSSDDSAWEQLAPLLDEAIGRLRTADRNVVVLRYFQNKSAHEIAAVLNIGEAAAKKRLTRAVEKLRLDFFKRGVNVSTATLSGAVLTHSVHVAPMALTKAVTAVALAKNTTTSISTLTLVKGALKIMAWTKAKTAIAVGTAIVLATGTTVVVVKETAAPTGSAADRAPVMMETKWQIGKKYLAHKEDVQTMEVKNPGQSKPVKQVQKQTEDFYYIPVRQLENGGWQLQLEFTSLALEVANGDRGVFAANSAQNGAQDARNPVGARLRKMVGARLEYFTDVNGKVEQMNGYPELVNRVAGSDAKEQAAFKDLFSEINLEKYGSAGEDTVPRRVVKLGDRWAISMKVPSNGGDLQVDVKCRFKNWEQRADHKCIHITFTGSISPVAGSAASTLRVKIEKGTVTGDIWFDPELGMAVESAQDVNVQLKINQNGQIQTVPLNEKTRGTLIAVEDV